MVPHRPKHPCAVPGCPNLTDERYCEEHRVSERRKYDKFERDPGVNKKYGRGWRSIRDKYATSHPLCEMCLKEGRFTPVQEVHHRVPVSRGGSNSWSNLMSLCQSCHMKIHHELGDR